MTLIQLPYFGEIDIDSLKDYYQTRTQIGQMEIQLDINFPKTTTDINTMNIIRKFLENIEDMDKENVKYYTKDFNDKREANAYIEFYFEESSEEELAELVDLTQSREIQKFQLLNKLELIRVGIYPDRVGCFGVFDYSIFLKMEGMYCNQLLVVFTDENGQLYEEVAWES